MKRYDTLTEDTLGLATNRWGPGYKFIHEKCLLSIFIARYRITSAFKYSLSKVNINGIHRMPGTFLANKEILEIVQKRRFCISNIKKSIVSKLVSL